MLCLSGTSTLLLLVDPPLHFLLSLCACLCVCVSVSGCHCDAAERQACVEALEELDSKFEAFEEVNQARTAAEEKVMLQEEELDELRAALAATTTAAAAAAAAAEQLEP